MTHRFSLNPAGLDDLAGQLEHLSKGEAEGISRSLRAINARLAGSWEGKYANTFSASFGDWTAKWQTICGDLALISTFLRESAQEYRRLEDARNQALAATESARWGGRAAQYPQPPATPPRPGYQDPARGEPAPDQDPARGEPAPDHGPGGGSGPIAGAPGGGESGPVAGAPGGGESGPVASAPGGGGAPGSVTAPPPGSEIPDPMLPGESGPGDGLPLMPDDGPGSRPQDPIRADTPDFSWVLDPTPGGPLYGVPAETARHLANDFKEWLAENGIRLEDLGQPLSFRPEQLQHLDRIWSQYGIDLPDEALRGPLRLMPEQIQRFLEWADPHMDNPPMEAFDPDFNPETGQWWNGYTWVDDDPTPPDMMHTGGSNRFDERTGLWWTGEMWTDEPPTPRPDLPEPTRTGDAPYLGEPLLDNGRTGDAPYLGVPLPEPSRTGDAPYLGEPLPEPSRTGDAPDRGRRFDVQLTREQAQVVDAWITANARGHHGPQIWPGLEAS